MLIFVCMCDMKKTTSPISYKFLLSFLVFPKVCTAYRIMGTGTCIFTGVNFHIHHYMGITESICKGNFLAKWPAL